jgi:PAS domain S-box-containing protein
MVSGDGSFSLMDWKLVAWPAMGAMCLTLVIIHGVIWARHGGRRAHLALACVLVAIIAVSLLTPARALSPGLDLFLQPYSELAGAALFVAMASFVHLEFETSRRSLFSAVVVSRLAALAVGWAAGGVAVAVSPPGQWPLPSWGGPWPWTGSHMGLWALLCEASTVFMVAHLADTLLRERANAMRAPHAMRVLGALLVFVLASEAWRLGVLAGTLHTPDLLVPISIVVVLVTSYEVAGEVLHSTQLSEDLSTTRSRLHESQVRMHEAVKAARLSLWNWDFRRGRFWASGIGQAMLDGEAASEQSELFGDVHPDDRPRVQRALDAASEDDNFYCEFRLRPVAGLSSHWMVARGRIERGADGKPARMYGVLADISERKQGEERFQVAVEASPTAMLMVDAGGDITLVNRQAEFVFGYERGELLGLGVERLVPRPLAEEHRIRRERFRDTPSARIMGEARELRALRRDGEEFPVEILLTPIRVGDELLTLASVTDISERKRLEHESAVHRDELAHLSRVALLSELSGSLAHELNQPLTAILSNAQAALRFMAQSPPNLDEVKKILSLIVDSDKRAGEVIRRLGAMLRKEPANHQLLDLDEVIRDVLRIVRSDLLNRNTRTALDLHGHLPTVRGHPVQRQQVLMTLLMNGCDAMREVPVDRRVLVVSTRQLSGNAVRVSVQDCGHGIPQGELERIFEPFVTTKQTGLGLGLAVCSTIIRSHHGRLIAENLPSGGASFSFELPIVR